jgi:hypothetical protein
MIKGGSSLRKLARPFNQHFATREGKFPESGVVITSKNKDAGGPSQPEE